MKLLALLSILLVTACSTKHIPNTSVQARLVKVEHKDNSRYILWFIDHAGSSRIVNYSRNSIIRPAFYIGDQYSISFDSAACKPCDSTHPAKAIIKHNQ